jgi:hypothetical protein
MQTGMSLKNRFATDQAAACFSEGPAALVAAAAVAASPAIAAAPPAVSSSAEIAVWRKIVQRKNARQRPIFVGKCGASVH